MTRTSNYALTLAYYKCQLPELRSSSAMAFRSPFAIPRRILSNASISGVRPVTSGYVACYRNQRRGLATAVPPVTQDATGSKGPTAMVFLNMGGPSTTGEVEDFLSRLFVRSR